MQQAIQSQRGSLSNRNICEICLTEMLGGEGNWGEPQLCAKVLLCPLFTPYPVPKQMDGGFLSSPASLKFLLIFRAREAEQFFFLHKQVKGFFLFCFTILCTCIQKQAQKINSMWILLSLVKEGYLQPPEKQIGRWGTPFGWQMLQTEEDCWRMLGSTGGTSMSFAVKTAANTWSWISHEFKWRDLTQAAILVSS